MKNTYDRQDQRLQSAREMCRHPTPAEDALWAELRGRQLAGLKFRRQFVIEPLIADFYCAAARLIVELDGDIHDYRVNYDAVRTRHFEDHGYQVIRFRNEEVLEALESILSQIEDVAFAQISYLSKEANRKKSTLNPKYSPNPGRDEFPLTPNPSERTKTLHGSLDSGRGESPPPLELGEGVGGEVELPASMPPKILSRSTI